MKINRKIRIPTLDACMWNVFLKVVLVFLYSCKMLGTESKWTIWTKKLIRKENWKSKLQIKFAVEQEKLWYKVNCEQKSDISEVCFEKKESWETIKTKKLLKHGKGY